MMLLVKIRNSGQLFWETLDAEERRVIVYLAVYLGVTLLLGARTRMREQLKAEIREELRAGH